MDEDLNKAQIDAEADGFSLIDVSNSDDDFLFASSSDASIVDNPGFAEGVPMNQPSDPLALHRPKKTGKCNLRKSLAWDTAFFTNAGVLDPEELSSIIEGAETGGKHSSFLPGIQEDLSKSTDSISTFQSDLTLESLEADLFCDIRASIQRCSKSSTTGNSRGAKFHEEDQNINGSSMKLADPSARKLAKPKSASNKLSSGLQGSVRTLKPGPVSKHEKPPVNWSREPSSSLSRSPKAASQSNLQKAATTKRMSVGAGRAKQNTNAVGNVKGKGSSLPEAPNQANSRKPLPKAPVLSKVSAPLVLKKAATCSSQSSCNSSSSSTSGNVRKSQTGVVRKKMEKTVNLPSVSKIKTSSKVVDKPKSQSKESCLAAYVKSSSNLSPNVSPASSISEWSTESSSSTATVNQQHFCLSSFPSSQDVAINSSISRKLHSLSSHRALGGHDHQVPGINNQTLKKPSTGSASNTCSGVAKPSGLRMPSPNIGFFDGVKAGVRTPSSSSRPRTALPSSLPRSVAGTYSPSGTGTINKSKLGTNASKVTAAGIAKLKHKISDANPKTAPRPVDHCIDLKNPSGAKHIGNESENSSGSHRSTPLKSALERNTPEASGLEIHVPDSWLLSEDDLGSDIIAGEKASSENFQSTSPKSALEKHHKIPESSEPGNSVLDSQLVGKDNLACEVVILTTEDAPIAYSKLAKGNISVLVLEKDNEVTEVLIGGEPALELASMVKDNLIASERAEENLLITADMGNFITKYQLEGDPQCTDPNLMPTVKKADGGEYSIPDFGLVVKDGSPVQGKEEMLHSNNDLVTFTSEVGSQTDTVEISPAISHSNIKEKIFNIVSDPTPLQVDAADNLESVSQHTQQDEGRSAGPCANDKNQCVENVLVEIKESYVANYEGETQVESHISVQSLSDKFSSLILNSPLPNSVVDSLARTPFAVKNSESNVFDMSN